MRLLGNSHDFVVKAVNWHLAALGLVWLLLRITWIVCAVKNGV